MTAESSGTSYAFKPSLLGALWTFDLTPDALVWRAGRRDVAFPYADIVRLRLTYRPQSLQAQRYRADIVRRDGKRVAILSVTWRGMLAVTPQAKAYSAFMRELHTRLDRAGATTDFRTGLPGPLYWTGLGVLGVLALVLAALAIRAMFDGYWPGAAFVAGFMTLSAWQLGGFFRRNRPRLYCARDIPPDLLPS